MLVAATPALAIMPPSPPRFDAVYAAHFDFVWRSARRLGVHPPATDDVVQDAFLVVYRKLPEFEGRSSLRTWLFAIVRRVVQDHRRRAKRKPEAPLEDSPSLAADSQEGPHAMTAAREAAVILERFLDRLPDAQREVFVAAEIEQLTAPEIARETGIKLNTVYSRLRLARAAFERAVAASALSHADSAAHTQGAAS